MGTKRSHTDMTDASKATATTARAPASAPQQQQQSPYMDMFSTFRSELDMHHERRERIIKASRDITAASKKIIFTLQRVRECGTGSISAKIAAGNKAYYETIAERLRGVQPDLCGLNAWRYARQISGGAQEYMEAVSFEHYLAKAEVIGFDESRELMRALSLSAAKEGGEAMGVHGSEEGIALTPEDYVLGIYDMTGELMRFAITAMATSGKLPAPAASSAGAEGDRNVLTDMRLLRSLLESLEPGHGPFAKDVVKKMEVMQSSVEKVEKALYGLVVRGAERPAGWMPDTSEGNRSVEVEG